MARIFASLTVAQLIVFAGTAAVGLFMPGEHSSRHILLGIFGLLLSCFTQVALFTYFTVTGKMIVQAVHLGHLAQEPLAMVKTLKRSIARLLALAFLSIVAIVITGATHWRSMDFGAVHMFVAGVAVIVHCFVYYRELGLIVRNAALLHGTLHAYQQRKKTGLNKIEALQVS